MGWLRKKQKSDQNERRRPVNSNPAVFSYYARGSSPRGQNTGRHEPASEVKKHYRLRLGHAPSYVALLAIVIALGYSCMLQPDPKIILVNTPNTVHRDTKAYQKAIQTIWKKSLKNRSKLTVSTTGLRQDITTQFSELSAVQIELPLLGRRPTVVLTPTRPALQLVSTNGAFYIDATGKVMGRITDFTQNELKDVPLIHDESSTLAEPGKGVISGPQASYLRKLSAQLAAQGITVQSITLPARVANEADVRIASQQYYVKFSIDTDPRQAVGTYLAAKAKLEAERAIPAEYIDVRVEEKVFYR